MAATCAWGEAGVLAQLRELVAALLGPERGAAPLALSNSLRPITYPV